jgi:hypothetical protein
MSDFQVEISSIDIIDNRTNHIQVERNPKNRKKTIHVSSDASRSQEKTLWGKPLERYGPSRGDGPSGMDFISQTQSTEFSSQITLD